MDDFDLKNLSSKFDWPEYIVFAVMLLVSAGIGVFFGCFGKRTESTTAFLMGGRSMSTFPVAMSILASFISAIMLLGVPAEMYQYGTQFWIVFIPYLVIMASSAHVYLPVFYGLQLTSVYEYLELRFSKSVRQLGSALFALQMTTYMAIVVYAPALALSQVTGIDVTVATTGMFLVCTFYTALGGMKAVIWTDTFQVMVMFGAMLVVVFKGMVDVGGNEVVWEAARNGSRIEWFNFDFDPRERHTIWSLCIGGYFTWTTIYATNQAQVQRYLTLPTIRMAQKAVWINYFFFVVLLNICCYTGLIIYAKYSHCDPLLTGKVKSPDQLLPLFVMDTLSEYPGLAGLFVAGIFSGSLSTVSSGLNSLAAITLEDFVRPKWPQLTEERATQIVKWVAVGFGLLCYGLTFVAATLGAGVLQAALTIFGVVGGPLLGVFTLGMFFPWANAKGALVGTLTSVLFVVWLGFGANISISNKSLVIPKKQFSTSGCSFNVTSSLVQTGTVAEGQSGGILEFYRLSYMWYSLIGTSITLIVGLALSFMTGPQNPKKLSPRLICPSFNRLLKFLFTDQFLRKIGWEIGTELDSSTIMDKKGNCLPSNNKFDGDTKL